MQSTMMGWIAFVVLAALIGVTSCQAWYGAGSASTEAEQRETDK